MHVVQVHSAQLWLSRLACITLPLAGSFCKALAISSGLYHPHSCRFILHNSGYLAWLVSPSLMQVHSARLWLSRLAYIALPLAGSFCKALAISSGLYHPPSRRFILQGSGYLVWHISLSLLQVQYARLWLSRLACITLTLAGSF
ncbi:hypothetical protein DPMN_069852 [Dreissena polymorpha]|uniref:Uncharacterized protein n=1 Tax=Dreissena polymorpha TaxID=45954 RepID=A0A9D4BUQ2_DREPO|nr:hypothetical protein DPMN_069852 [Dreissena polymorpha]